MKIDILFEFTGRRVDILDSGSLKIQYNRNRYYDYYAGRWLTHDPLGITPNCIKPNVFRPLGQYKDALNLYEMMDSNPVVNNDPWGLRLFEPGEYAAKRGVISIYLSDSYAGKFMVDVQIFFYPNEKARSCCDKISFGQIVTTYKHTTLGKEDTGWHLDKSFPYKLSTPWTKNPPKWRAEAEDHVGYTGVFRLYELNQDFETCAICMEGCEIGANYGCVFWSHSFSRCINPATKAIDYFISRIVFSSGTWGWLSSPPVNISAFEHEPKSPSGKFHTIIDPVIP